MSTDMRITKIDAEIIDIVEKSAAISIARLVRAVSNIMAALYGIGNTLALRNTIYQRVQELAKGGKIYIKKEEAMQYDPNALIFTVKKEDAS